MDVFHVANLSNSPFKEICTSTLQTTLAKDGNPFTAEMVRHLLKNQNLKNIKSLEKKNLQVMLQDLKIQTINIFKSSYLKRMIIVSVATFSLMSPYNTLLLWFPELLERFARFENRYPNESASVCDVTQRRGLFNSIDSNLVSFFLIMKYNKSQKITIKCDNCSFL